MADGRITAEVYDGLWFDVGTMERLDALKSRLKVKG
jgi:NDP-sugar pyrophosphorylase family protein